MNVGAKRGRIGFVIVMACAALVGTGGAIAAVAQSDVSVVRVMDDNDPDLEIPSDSLDFLLAPDDADVELLPFQTGGREMLENSRFDLEAEFI